MGRAARVVWSRKAIGRQGERPPSGLRRPLATNRLRARKEPKRGHLARRQVDERLRWLEPWKCTTNLAQGHCRLQRRHAFEADSVPELCSSKVLTESISSDPAHVPELTPQRCGGPRGDRSDPRCTNNCHCRRGSIDDDRLANTHARLCPTKLGGLDPRQDLLGELRSHRKEKVSAHSTPAPRL